MPEENGVNRTVDSAEMTFWGHLDELRKVIFRILIAVTVFTLLAFCFKDELFGIVLAPKDSNFCVYRLFDWVGSTLHIPGLDSDCFSVKLINTKLSGQFMTHMAVSFYAGIILTSPYILYQLFRFVSPALYANERHYSIRVVTCGYVLFVLGVLFSYFVVFPFTFRFLGTYQVSEEIENTIMLSSYIDTLSMLSLLMGTLFEIPVLAWLFAKLGFISSDFLKTYRKHAFVLSLIVAAVITPTSDAFTLMLVTIPIVALYEVSIFVVAHTRGKDKSVQKVLTVCLCLLALSGKGEAKSPESIQFSHISIRNGLSQNTIFSITQDLKGCLWLATYDGVNKYDGYGFTVYQHNPSDTTTIASDAPRTIMTDESGVVWIGTSKGLSRYNEEKDIFENYSLSDRKNIGVNNVVQLSADRLLVRANKQLYLFDVRTHRFTRDGVPEVLAPLYVSSLYKADNKVFIGTTTAGVFVWDYLQNRSSVTRIGPESTASVQAMLLQSPTRFWIGTEGSGLYLINPLTGEQSRYSHSSVGGGLSSNYVRALALDANGRLWVGTFNDLNIYNESNDTFTAYTCDPLDAGSLSQRSVRCIYQDSQGGMWLGTYFGGLNYYHPLKNRFRNIQRIPYKRTLSDNVVSCMVEDRNRNIWIGTNDGGITLYNPIEETYSYYTFDHDRETPMSESNNIKSIYIDEARDVVYIGTHAGGLKILHRKTGQTEHYPAEHAPSVPQNIYSIVPYRVDELWIGSLSGLFLFHKDSKTFTPVTHCVNGAEIPLQPINVLFEDSHRRLWVGGKEKLKLYQITDKGLLPLPLPDKAMESAGQIQAFYEDTGHSVWIGTRYGLYRWNEQKHETRHYTTANGLPNNVVYGMEEDTYHFIWISTNRGLSCLNCNTGKFRNFTASDGLQSNQFNMYAHCRTAEGDMYFGGINGITTFRPELLIDNPYTPQPVITKFLLYNKEVRPDDETDILTRSISCTREITLQPSQRAFTIEFVVSNFISGENTFAYKLEGFDSDWYSQTDKRSVSYSNLPAGHYRFLVKAANSDGKWNQEPTVLDIEVLPAWYATWWARLLFVLLVVSVITLVMRYLWLRKSMEAKLALEHKEKLHQEEMAQMKMRFFINISHELRTPLTLILAPVQEMLAHTQDKWMKEQLDYVKRNANRLLNLVNQLMDYRRAELGVFKLKVEQIDVYALVKENFSFYEKLARHKGLEYTLLSDVEGQTFYADAKYVELILNNLLSNAFKYTEKGRVTVRLTRSSNCLLLEVSDTGTGIEEDKHKRVFERFYQLENSHVGSGIGLSLVQRLVELHHGSIELASERGKGSTFTILLPQDVSAYKADEWGTDAGGEDAQDVHSTNPKEMYFIDTEKEAEPEDTDSDRKRGTVLVVEDNEEIRHYLCRGLSDTFAVRQATNGVEALDVLKQNDTDLVISDVMMPVMDGIKLCKQIKQNINTSHIPVIMLSAKTDIQAQMEAMQTGADDYIAKPFSLSLLTTKVQNWIRTRVRMREYYAKSTEIEPEKITFSSIDEELLKRAIGVVKANMDNPEFSAEDFARGMNMSRSNLHLKLKAITGESAIEFIRKIRFNEACRLLREGRHNIAEVSTMVGFNTPSYFSTVFKKYMGCLPTEYVKKGLKN